MVTPPPHTHPCMQARTLSVFPWRSIPEAPAYRAPVTADAPHPDYFAVLMRDHDGQERWVADFGSREEAEAYVHYRTMVEQWLPFDPGVPDPDWSNAERWALVLERYDRARALARLFRAGKQRLSLRTALTFGEGAHMILSQGSEMNAAVDAGLMRQVLEALAVLWESHRALSLARRRARQASSAR